MKPSEETRRLKLIRAAATNVLTARGEAFYRTLLLPGGPEGAGQWGTDTISLWVRSGMLSVIDDSNPAKRVFQSARHDIWQAIIDNDDVAGWYITQRITSVRKNGSPEVPPQFQNELQSELQSELQNEFQSQVRLVEDSEPDEPEPEQDPLEAYIGRTVAVLENLDARQRELLKEIKDQSDLVLNAVSRLDTVASRDDVAGAAAELIGVVVKQPKDEIAIRIESLSSGVSALHTNVSSMQKNMETVLAHLGRTFADRLDAQREASDKRMSQFEAKVDAAMQRIEASHLPDVKPFEELMGKLIDNIETFAKLKNRTNEAQEKYNEYFEDGIKTAKLLVATAFAIVKSAGASPEEIAETIASASSLKTITAVGLAMKPAVIKDEPNGEKTNRRMRRAIASVERK